MTSNWNLLRFVTYLVKITRVEMCLVNLVDRSIIGLPHNVVSNLNFWNLSFLLFAESIVDKRRLEGRSCVDHICINRFSI
jgi:hypothetical protein